MLRTLTSSLVLLIACSAGAAAMEVADLRFGAGVGPTPKGNGGVFTSDAGGNLTVDTTYASRSAGTLLISGTIGTLDPLGFLFGGELRYAAGESGIDSMTVSNTAVSLAGVPESNYVESAAAIHAGFGWAPSERTHFELLALAGFAQATLDSPADISTDNLASEKGSGTGVLYGVRAGWFTTFDSRWQLGLEVEWTHTAIDLTTDYADGRLLSTIDTMGLGARALLGYRF
jgi:hypothetical protein